MSYRIYLVEDDTNLNLVLTSYLQQEGWQVRSFQNGSEARKAIEKQPDLWILDIMLPDIDGYHLLQEIKAADPKVPVIYISARDADIDRVVGLELGCDDYLAKPYFIKNMGIALSRDRILENIWGRNYFGNDRVVDDLVRRLRKKMPDLRLETIYGYGYRMVKP